MMITILYIYISFPHAAAMKKLRAVCRKKKRRSHALTPAEVVPAASL